MVDMSAVEGVEHVTAHGGDVARRGGDHLGHALVGERRHGAAGVGGVGGAAATTGGFTSTGGAATTGVAAGSGLRMT
jgi:hypothetical protein